MTSISQGQTIPPQAANATAQSVVSVQSPPPTGGATSQQAAAGRSFANQPRTRGSPTTAEGASHGKAESSSSINGKPTITPAVPTFGGPTIVNGSNVISPTAHSSDHGRKASVTISASGSSGQMPNGGPIAGKPAAGNGIQFGQMSAGASPSIANNLPYQGPSSSTLSVASPANPRITSPTSSPSPIPQPSASGGRPPSSLHNQGNGLSFGSMGEDPSRQTRPGMPSGSLTPAMHTSHLRRESSQSSQADMGNGGMGSNGGRGGYAQHGGRGRGMASQYNQQMPYSPNPAIRGVPNAPRGGQSGPPPFSNQPNRSLGAYPHSPHQSTRSPSLANSQPIHPQGGQMPMPSPGMQQAPYGGFNQHMSPHHVNPHFSSAFSVKAPSRQKAGRPAASDLLKQPAPSYIPADFSPESGHFEYFLMHRNSQGQFMPQPYDPNYGFYASQYGIPQSMHMPQYMQGMNVPPSPRPHYPGPQGQPPQQYMPNQNNPSQQMSRTPSGVSDRPSSNAPQPPTPMTPAVSHQPQSGHGANSPAPKSNNFQVPARKNAGIVIRDPNSGAVKTFDRKESPALGAPTKSPTNVSATSTPPPRTPSAQHTRTESQSTKTNDEKVRNMKDAIAKKIKADEEAERRKKEDLEAAAQKEKDASNAKVAEVAKSDTPLIVQSTESDESSEAEQTPVEGKKAEPTEEKSEKAVEEAPQDKEPEEDPDSDEYWARIEREEAEREAERERKYQERKAAQEAERARKAAEEAARADEELKKAEREAEAIEEARMKKLENEGDDKAEKQNMFQALKKDENAFQATQTPPTIETPAESGAATPVSDASSMGPPRGVGVGAKPKPAALKLETSKQVEAPQPSAALQSLRSARFLTTINEKTYPPDIASPNPALNSAAPMKQFRYDKNFLMQFQDVFVEKPSETWAERVKETVGDTSDTPASARSRAGGAMPPRMASSRPSVMPGGPFAGGNSAFGAFAATRTLPPGTTSQARYDAALHNKATANAPLRYTNTAGAFPMGFSNAMSRTASSTSLGHPSSPRNNQSHRGSGRGSKAGKRESEKDAKTMPLTAGQEVKPIQISASGWKPTSVGQSAAAGPPPGGDGYLAPDVVQRKVKAALNKMTPTTFDKISGQILDIVAQSKRETDGRTLRQVIQLTFEKATDEAHWAQMYAEFCSRMLQNMSPDIKDETLGLDKNGKVNAGGTLFRKYLLNRCQQDFEAGWKSKLPEKPEGTSEEAAMLSDEYYIAAAAKRRGLGLVRFIGELYKLGMLTSRIMHMCVKRLVDFEGMPDEAEVESLTSLLKTIGESLDAEEKARPSMDAYFERINTMINLEGLPSRLKFMLMDIVDLRKKGWKGKEATKGPATIDEVRAQAAAVERQKEAQRVADSSRRGGGRPGLGRGDARGYGGGGPMAPPPQQNTVGIDDLKRLSRGGSRQASAQGTMSFGPTSMFSTRGSNTQRRTLGSGILSRGGEDSGASSRTATPPFGRDKKDKEDREAASQHANNAFSALAGLDSGESNDNPASSPPSTTSSPPVAKARPLIEQQRSKSPLRGNETSAP